MPRKLPVISSRKENYYAFRCRVYRQNESRPYFTNLIAQDKISPFKQTHSAFHDNSPKAYIYDYTITITEGRRQHDFHLSCKHRMSSGLTLNQTLNKKMCATWMGDIVVMRIGKKNPARAVDMGGKDACRVDYAVKK